MEVQRAADSEFSVWRVAIAVSAILLLMAAIAIPSRIRSGPGPLNSIFNNLRVIEGAKNQWALDKKQPVGAVPTWSDRAPYLMNGKFPRYVLKERYTLNAVGTPASTNAPVKSGTYPAGSTITAD